MPGTRYARIIEHEPDPTPACRGTKHVMMIQEPMNNRQFEKRLVELCLRGGQTCLPRKRADRHIQLQSIVLCLDGEKTYTEKEVQLELQLWLTGIGEHILTDHATLRRLLVDEGYMTRDRNGSVYRVAGRVPHPIIFDPSIAGVDVRLVMDRNRISIEQKKQEHAGRKQ